MSDTAMARALRRAGVKSPTERLKEITLKAMVTHADNTFACCDAIWEEVQKDRGLLVSLFQYAWRREVSALMHRVRADLMYDMKQGTLKRPLDLKAAEVAAAIRREDERQEAEDRAEERRHQAELDRQHQAHLASWRATRIGNLYINETPVWEHSAVSVRGWLVTEKRRWRTLELLIEGLPNDDRPIAYYRRPEEVEALWHVAATE